MGRLNPISRTGTNCALCLFALFVGFSVVAEPLQPKRPERRIFIYGGDVQPVFVEYVCALTGKSAPRVCYLPTASADHAANIEYWEFICRNVGIESHVMRVWIDSESQKESFAELLLGMDALVVGGGNTLNMLGIWKAQGIDTVLREAFDRGIVLSGGSAGSLCWFRCGVSDARPGNLSVVEGLGILPYSHCPHYDTAAKRKCYDDLVKRGRLPAGYACEEHAGILFTDGRVSDVVSSDHQARSYVVSRCKDGLRVDTLTPRILVRKGALDESAYRKERVRKRVDECRDVPSSMQTPLSAFVCIQRLFAEGRYSEYAAYAASGIRSRVEGMEDRPVEAATADAILATEIIAVFECGEFAAVLSKGKAEFYSLWYFLREGGYWKCAGEDIGGASEPDGETTFREKAPSLMSASKSDPSCGSHPQSL